MSKDLTKKKNSLADEEDDYGDDDYPSPTTLEHSPSLVSLPTFPDQPPPLNTSSSYTDKFKKNVIKMFLSKKILKRPPIEQLKKNGIIKGSHPSILLQSTNCNILLITHILIYQIMKKKMIILFFKSIILNF